MKQIPIEFEHGGKAYKGYFSQVAGGGCSGAWHLMILEHRKGKMNHYYSGQLFYTQQWGWQFGEHFKDLAQYFGDYITAWYQ